MRPSPFLSEGGRPHPYFKGQKVTLSFVLERKVSWPFPPFSEELKRVPPLFPFKRERTAAPLVSLSNEKDDGPSFPFEGQLANRPCLAPHIVCRVPRPLFVSLRVGQSRAAPASITKRTMELVFHLFSAHAMNLMFMNALYMGIHRF